MAEKFDPYHKWLGIPPKDQPPNAYRLLGLDLFEFDPDVIDAAADQRMAHVKSLATGVHSALSQKILNELAAAKICLLHPYRKEVYDRDLRAKMPRSLPVEEPIDPPVWTPPTYASTRSIRKKARASWMPWAVAGLVGLLAVVALLVVAISSSGKKEKEVVKSSPQTGPRTEPRRELRPVLKPKIEPTPVPKAKARKPGPEPELVASKPTKIEPKPAPQPQVAAKSEPTSLTFGRRWTDSSGSRAIEAEFVECKNGRVLLRKKSGQVVRVPINRLSEADQAFVKKQIGGADRPGDQIADKGVAGEESKGENNAGKEGTVASPAPETNARKVWTYTQLVEASNHCKTAKEVLLLYKIFISDPTIAESQRDAARDQMAVWQERAEKNVVRSGSSWMDPDDLLNRKERASQLVEEGCRLLDAGQGRRARDKMIEASKADPHEIQADFLLGLGYALVARDAKNAKRHFAECVKRSPAHISALNNLALAEIRMRDYNAAASHWQTALQSAPASAEIAQNMGRFLDLAGKRSINASPAAVRRISDIAAGLPSSVGRYEHGVGWLYMRFYETDNSPVTPKESATKVEPKPDPEPQQGGRRLIVVGSGSGFVVHPHYILTNRHVAADGDAFLVFTQSEPKKSLPATLVAKTDDTGPDIAVLRCDELNAPPVQFIGDDVARQGTEVGILGFPGVHLTKTTPFMFTRGSICKLPTDRDSEKFYFMDAVANPGNSGGPIFDARGGVLGILTAITRNQAFNYSLGIPHSEALPFLEKNVPEFHRLIVTGSAKKEWPDVIDVVGRSTVFVEIQRVMSDRGLPKALDKKESGEESGKRKWNACEDPWCMYCYGRGTMKCPNCQNGTVRSTRTEVVGRNPVTGAQIQQIVPIRVPCKTCHGTGRVPCSYCNNGYDDSLSHNQMDRRSRASTKQGLRKNISPSGQ